MRPSRALCPCAAPNGPFPIAPDSGSVVAMRNRQRQPARSVAGSARRIVPAALLFASLGAAYATKALGEVPAGIVRQVPPGYVVLGNAAASFGSHAFHIVALGKLGEDTPPSPPHPAAARPLLLFERRPDGSFRQAGRNDAVVMRADDGGQCDPFLDGGGTIAVKDRYFTVENGVACGQHWTDYITFRFDDALGRYVFDNEKSESWTMNLDRRPSAEIMVRDPPRKIKRGDKAHPVPFERWRPSWTRGE